ncbi:PREDICTED: transcription initiation protein SPT3 homolog [Atta cephalotes]|uniref:S1 motif domain-containing protein n=1 Tax=Atta cephalotes TaxID=12957 RepID=A0A158NN48_ATTCE|nr:PREDICTED: transcription initiation protein SPT3 homolog [Atta cephalotes]XP_018048600.1 PREDICTED: transcription initiation protein SPT3 homolog isoform X2 [Atta colombica]
MTEQEELVICVPGQRLCVADKSNVAGAGTYEQQGYIYSKLAGIVKLVTDDKTRTVEVHSITEQSIVPAPGDIVTAMVTVVNQRFCKCSIKCVGDIVLTRPYRGILRKEDVRAIDKDKLEMYKCYRPGDIILARVMPMTEIHSYQLSTAENELGVVIAHSDEEIRQMMHGFGDSSEPLFESAKIIEDVVLQQMKIIVRRACEIADRRANSKKSNIINGEDLLFLLRKDKIRLQRIVKYLELKELGCSVQKLMTANDVPQNVTDPEQLDIKKKVPFQSFLEQIDNTGELLENSSSVDDVKRRRCIRADIASKSMDEVHYMKFSKARRVSFANKNRHKFSDWICADGDVTVSKQAYTILSYLAYETVAQIVDLAFLVRQDQGKMHGDAIDRQRLNYINPFTFKPRYHSKNFVMKPLTPSEITEALRRYWSPQLDMTGPFNRWSMRRPHLKLLSC